jgi:Holliday junction resolvasome RuvABC DNA-binding subunit
MFDRTSKRVNLEGCATAQEINARLKRKINEYKTTDTEGPLEQFQLEKKIRSLKTLVEAGFARRTIYEAMANPRGKVALTLRYGRKRALHILSKRKGII